MTDSSLTDSSLTDTSGLADIPRASGTSNTGRPGYHAQSVPIAAEPLVLAATLARAATGPVVVYERGGEWLCGFGALAEIAVYADSVRTRTRADGQWRTQPTGQAPLRQVRAFLDALGVAGWRAYGWAGFELVHLLHGLPSPAPDRPVLHLVVPDREIRMAAGVATVRAADPADLPALVAAVSGAGAAAPTSTRPPPTGPPPTSSTAPTTTAGRSRRRWPTSPPAACAR